jgi:tetratricopeptide (TPR) repeat protein
VLPLVAVLLVRCAFAQQATAYLEGTLRNAGGTAVAGTIVWLEPADHSKTFSTRTDAEGKYRFSIPPGVYTLSASVLQSHARVASILVGAKESKTVVLVLEEEAARQQAICDGRLPARVHADIEDCTLATFPALSTMEEGQVPPPTRPQFSDEPAFTVAGVKDTTNLGGHGSGAVVRARNNLARETASLGKTSASEPAAGVSVDAKSLREKVAGEPNNPELHHRLADLAEQLGDPLEAVREYQKAAELTPTESYLFDWGSELLLHHAPEPAIEVFTRGRSRFPKSTRIALGLGAAYFALGSSEKAVREICRASDRDPDNPAPYLFLGKMLRTEKTAANEVLEKLRRFATLQPQNADANYFYALALSKQPNDTSDQTRLEMESLLKRAVEIKPDFAAAYLQLGVLYSEHHANEQAIAALKQAAQADPRMEEPHYRLSQIYRQLGETEKSKQELQTYDQLSKKSEQQAERERHEIRQFVYTLRDQPSAQPR